MDKRNPKYGFCAKVHGKVFEIILLIGFIIAIGTLLAFFLLTKWYIKFSTYLLYGVYGLLAINFLSMIFTIILRVWRSNGSVLKDHSSSSSAISILIVILILINFLCSIAGDILYHIGISVDVGGDEGDVDDNEEEDEGDEEDDSEKRNLDEYVKDIDIANVNTVLIYNDDKSDTDNASNDIDIIIHDENTHVNENIEISYIYDDPDQEDDFQRYKKVLSVMNKLDEETLRGFIDEFEEIKKLEKLKGLPFIILNVNPFIQIISLIFIIFIIKRIKIKSHYGINSLNESSIRNQIGSTKNVRDINDNQDDNIFKGNIKKNKKKTKNNKISKKNTTSSPNSAQLEIMNNKRNKKKQRDKKRKHKYKK